MYTSDAFGTLRQIATGHILSRCLHVVADLGVADVLDETPRTAGELAALVDAHPRSLGRVLTLLAAHGVFDVQGERFCHSPASRLLISDHPTQRAFVHTRFRGSRWTGRRTRSSTTRCARENRPWRR